MTKTDKIKLGVALGVGGLALVILVWHFFLSTPKSDVLDEVVDTPVGANPNAMTPGGKK